MGMDGSAVVPTATDSNWLPPTIGALAATVSHLFVDLHIGLFGPSADVVSLSQAANIGLLAAIFSVWAYAIARAQVSSKSALATVAVFCGLWAAFGNGVVAVIVAPPPSLGFPYQDITHAASLVFGATATVQVARELKKTPGPIRLVLPSIAVLLIVLNFALQAYLAL